MRKKALIGLMVASAVTVSAAMGGCSLVSTNNDEDLKQVIAEVNISETADFDSEFKNYFNESDYAEYKSTFAKTEVKKRELVSSFLNVGYSYVQNGSSYSEVFTMLVDALVSNAVLTQYSAMYLLKAKAEEDPAALKTYLSLETEKDKYEYLLGADSNEVKIAEYSLMSSINTAIDSYERTILDDDNSSAGTETRAVPENVDAEKENFFPKKRNANGDMLDKAGNVTTDEGKVAIDYNVYTGYEGYLIGGSGVYEDDALDGSTRATRIRAYNRFVSNLISYDLVDAEEEDLRDVRSLKYIQDEYVNQLKNQVIEKYYDLYEEEQEESLKSGNYEYIQAVYDDLLKLQEESNDTESSFSSAIGNMSDTSFVLYSPKTENGGNFGFVYNILLPFSASQNAELTRLQGLYADEDIDSGYNNKYYVARNKMLNAVTTTDQRAAWFNGETKYAYEAKGVNGVDYFGGSSWLFFENNTTENERYEKLKKYDGRYAYNGSVVEKEDDKFVLLANTLTIDGMLKEFTAYIDFVLGNNAASAVEFEAGYDKAEWKNTNGYYDTEDFLKNGGAINVDGFKEIDYAKLVYASGKVDLGSVTAGGVTDVSSRQYKVLSAVNELQYAYTTDTGVLSQYLGYTVEAGDTSYIKEFEYAAHEAINKGAGSFAVCAGNYGWHLIYVSYTFNADGGEVYSPDWAANWDKEGTFENLFYEWIKGNEIADVSTTRRTQIITKYNVESTVTKHESRYTDLLGLSD